MVLSGPSYYVLLLGAIFSSVFLHQDAVYCEKPTWANVAFDTKKQEGDQLSMGAPSNSLYGSVGQIFHSIFGLENLYASGKVLLVTIIGLVILCLLLRHIKTIKFFQANQGMTKIVPASGPNNELTQNNREMLEQLVKNTHKINKYMKLYVIGHYRKEMKCRISRRRKNYETESDHFLPVCSCHDSCQDSA
ncbi:uncharacterized protein LOC107983323 [Anolis carolinensis]|uniref:uncharacterized protein LOC107983323 n=1 Tax=Anolis carolinensis TaxID=28377 RepID=UPI000203A681|nr:PREDICTED: uncharacterized protein LOC107983323 [Anolis carolinensis]|eukprot:XP_016852054.1 PREDICTED: uncharacterized protein LOC107983323 [Anolis carolinensis]